jgi:hypothetical protein
MSHLVRISLDVTTVPEDVPAVLNLVSKLMTDVVTGYGFASSSVNVSAEESDDPVAALSHDQ